MAPDKLQELSELSRMQHAMMNQAAEKMAAGVREADDGTFQDALSMLLIIADLLI